jgi:hypothetical protein
MIVPPPKRKAKHIGFGINWNLLPSIDIVFVKCIEALIFQKCKKFGCPNLDYPR